MNVTISAYLKSRRYNETLYGRLVENIKKHCKRYAVEYPELEIAVSMSAKYQTPRIIISNNDEIPERIGGIQDAIIDALDEVGFSFVDSEDRSGYYAIEFKD